MKIFRQMLAISYLSLCSLGASHAGPWFTGPILAPAGHTLPKGHTNLEVYGLGVLNGGQFNSSGTKVRTPLFKSMVANPILGHGFTDWMDAQITVPYVANSTRGVDYHRLADTSLVLGFQLMEQKDSKFKPNLRFSIQEVIPTGRYERLNPQFLGTDSTGLGSYQTVFGLNFQHLAQVFDTHYLRTRLILSRLEASSVAIHGLSSYGGTVNTDGKIRPGSENDVDLAFEFTLTQNWVAVMEGYISQGQATRFNGMLNIGNLGSPDVNVGSGDYYEQALAPALEYNFNQNIGIIGGVWFPIKGKNTADYTAYVLALNAFW